MNVRGEGRMACTACCAPGDSPFMGLAGPRRSQIHYAMKDVGNDEWSRLIISNDSFLIRTDLKHCLFMSIILAA